MKTQILSLDTMSVESWFKPPTPVSRPARVWEPSTSVGGISTAGLLCGGVSFSEPDDEPTLDEMIDRYRTRGKFL